MPAPRTQVAPSALGLCTTVAAALLAGALPLPARADSSASSAVSNSVSASVGSLSTSVERSSDSSSKGKNVAAGDYRVIEVAAAPGREGQMRVRLQAVAGSGAEGEFFLYLPPATLAQGGIATGQVVSARTRPYGVEFAQGEPRQAFFLLMADDWFRELRTRVVVAS